VYLTTVRTQLQIASDLRMVLLMPLPPHHLLL